MPFSSLRDSVDLARAHGAFQMAWTEVLAQNLASEAASAERDRLAQIIVGLVPACLDEADLVKRAVARFAREDEES
jgi:hypothetical protein